MKKILMILAILAFIATAGCSSILYDCASVCENGNEQCSAEFGSFDTAACETSCENGDEFSEAATDEEITCGSQADSCSAYIACFLP